MHLLRYLLLLFLFPALPGLAQAQKQASIWYLGQQGLDFNYSPPRLLNDGAMRATESRATIADTQGRLLFYTNGQTILNRNHVVMANGENLAGHVSSRQGALIVTQPGSPSLYLVFTKGAVDYNLARGLRYSVDGQVRVYGFTDTKGSADYNEQLAEECAEAVV
jgi:hypothetical protein